MLQFMYSQALHVHARAWLISYDPRQPSARHSAVLQQLQLHAGEMGRKAGQDYQRNPIDWSLVDSMHDHRMAECMQSYVCLVLISVRDKVMVAGVFHIRDKSRNL